VFSAAGAAKWAKGCVNNCKECSCTPLDANGFCPTGCGCTPFVSQSLIHGGGWNHAAINVCADFHAYASADAKWTNVGTAASVVIPGDVIVMTPPGDKQYGHCCIGTANGLMTCHNKAHLNIAPGGKYYPVNAIFRHQLPPGSISNETVQWAPNPAIPNSQAQ
jgi:hypothetical protein